MFVFLCGIYLFFDIYFSFLSFHKYSQNQKILCFKDLINQDLILQSSIHFKKSGNVDVNFMYE